MSRAGEAISNVRMVRDVSSEAQEAERNRRVLNKALRAGIKDAIAGGVRCRH